VGSQGVPCRVVVATHPAGKKKSPVGVTRAGVVYELFFTNLPQRAFTASDVVELYLHRGVFVPALADEDQEIDPDRWCSHTAYGQEAWCVVSQWVWNLRLELGHHLKPQPLRTTECAPAIPEHPEQAAASSVPAAGYGPPTTATRLGKQDAFLVKIFLASPTGRCAVQPGRSLLPRSGEERVDGSLRVVYAASIRSCRPCPLREQCQWQGNATAKPRQGSRLLHPLAVGVAPLLWRDWSRRQHRRACTQLHCQRLEIQREPDLPANSALSPPTLSRAERAHYRLGWQERLARNARAATSGRITLKLFGIPEDIATSLGLAAA
jgi:hypothetical protein